ATEEDEEEDETEPLDLEAPPAPTGEPRASVVVIDHELSPRQLHNIEGATSAAEVLDRTGVIIQIFHLHASSRPARLQVEIARLTYVAPSVARDRRRGAPARRHRAERRGGVLRGARSPQDPRPYLRAQGGAGRHRRRVEDATGEASDGTARRAGRVHQRGQIVADARAHRLARAHRRQTVRDPRHYRPCAG